MSITTLFELIKTLEKLTHLQHTSDTAIKIGPTYSEDQKRIKIKKCFIALYPSADVISAAVRDGFDLIVSYKLPKFWFANQITDELYPKIKMLLDKRIYLYVIPTRFGNDHLLDIISDIFDFEIVDVVRIKDTTNQDLTIGRVCQPNSPSLTLHNLLSHLKEKLNIPIIRYIGSDTASLRKIAILFEYPITMDLMKLLKRKGIDTLFCTNITYETEKAITELSLNLIEVTDHINSLGLLKLTQLLRMEHIDVEFAFDRPRPSIKIFPSNPPSQ
ncbi:MAG: Nif3-like dinuclear metal center hexameric protein [Candidatus Helarchaeota archaeon]